MMKKAFVQIALLSSLLMCNVALGCNSDQARDDLQAEMTSGEGKYHRLKDQVRQAEEISEGFMIRLPYIREAAVQTVINYGCTDVDKNSEEFEIRFTAAFEKVAHDLGAHEKVSDAAKRIAALVVNEYGCVPGQVSPKGLAFESHYGATAMSEGDLEINRPNIRKAAALTIENYGCTVDLNSTEFNDIFRDAFEAVKYNLDPVEAAKRSPKVFLLASVRQVVAKFVNAYKGCAAGLPETEVVLPNDPKFNDKFQAAYAVEVLQLKYIGDERADAASFLEQYGCGHIDPKSKDFIEKYLSTFTETVVERKGHEDMYYLGTVQAGKLVRKYNCKLAN